MSKILVVDAAVILAPATRHDRHLNGSINTGYLYHCTLWASKGSLKVEQYVHLLNGV